MNDLRDFEFDKSEEADEYATGEFEKGGELEREDTLERSDHGGPLRWWPILLVVLLVVAALLYWRSRSDDPVEPALAPTQAEESAPPAESTAEPEEPLVLPELGASDALVAELVGALSANPRLAGMLVGEDLIRRFTAAIVNIAEGQSPRAHLRNIEPAEPFTVRRIDGDLVPSAKSYARYDLAANVIASLDTAGTVKLYRQLEPLIDEAFAELGYPGRDFEDLLVEALDHLIATPAIGPDVVLTERVAAYQFADPELESLSAAQKQLLRTGPENAGKIQAALRALRSELTKSG